MTDKKEFDPFDFCDDDWTRAVFEVSKTLPGRNPIGGSGENPPVSASPAEQRKKEIYQKMRELAARNDARRKR